MRQGVDTIGDLLVGVAKSIRYHLTLTYSPKHDLYVFAPLPTFSESKQAITLPFSTWQLLGGCANLHSSSPREQFPR